jgi:hypothetical protein
VLLMATWLGPPALTTSTLLIAWAGLAAVSLLGMMCATRVVPRLRRYVLWASEGWRHRVRYGIESGLEQLTVFTILLAVAMILAPHVTAALRGATALLAPVAILASAIPLVVIPESARSTMSPPDVWRALVRVTVVTSSLAMLMGVALWALPQRLGAFLLGDTFPQTREIIVVIAVEYAVGCWTFAISIYLRSMNRSQTALRLKASYAVVMLGAAIGAAAVFRTSSSVAAGIAASTVIITAAALVVIRPWAPRSAAVPAADGGRVTDGCST